MVQVRYQRSTHSTHTGSTPFLASPSRVCLYFRSSGWSITARVHQCTGEDRDAGPAVVYGCHVTLSPQNVCIQVVQVGLLFARSTVHSAHWMSFAMNRLNP